MFWMFVVLLLASTFGSAQAASQYCRLRCLSDGACMVGTKSIEQWLAPNPNDCSRIRGTVHGKIGVWQLEKGDPVFHEVESGDEIADVLAKGGNSDPWILFTKRERQAAGSPFDGDADDGSGSTGAKIGLPYGLVLPPRSGIAHLRVAPSDASGVLTVFNAATNRRVARLNVRNGRVPFNKISLRANTKYAYTFTTHANKRYEGRFAVASKQTANDVKADTEYTRRKQSIPPSQRDMVRAKVLIEYDLRWNALQILVRGGM